MEEQDECDVEQIYVCGIPVSKETAKIAYDAGQTVMKNGGYGKLWIEVKNYKITYISPSPRIKACGPDELREVSDYEEI